MLHWQVSRIGMIWLFLAVAVTVAPLFPHLPLWVMGIPLFGLGWRLGIYRGLLGAPGRLVRSLLVIVVVAGIGFSFRRLYGLEPMAAMLVCAFGLKLLEIRQRRDALVVLYLGYFVAATYALFDQSVVAGAVLLLAYTVITAGLVGIHQSGGVREYFRPLVTSALILLQALPLMVIFFLVMPRLGSFWSVPSPNSAVTGMSDKLSIGDITQLGQSAETAFRVTFDGEVPPKDQLYWRGLVFSGFDGKTWKPVSWGFQGGVVQWYGQTADWWAEDLVLGGEPFGYEIMIERQNGPWLYGLQGSITETKDTGVSRTQTLVAMVPVSKRFQYRVKSWPSVQFQPTDMPDVRRQMELSLPEGFNPQARAMAEQWARETADVDALINRVLDYYRADFYYTLQPPGLGRDSIDDFLFTSKQGFCEHFAASFVFLMRAAGVPARLVVGYQGGEVHPDEGYVTVRQYDAHAWAEVWIAGEGWRQVDPTAAVAPDRISQGLISLLTAPVVLGQSIASLDRYQGVIWVNKLRLYLDSLEYAWGYWVLGYQNVQTNVLEKLLGNLDFKRIVLFVLVGSAIVLLPVLVFALWPTGRKPINRLDSYYLKFCNKMAKAGCPRQTGEAPRQFAARCSQQFPQCKPAIMAIAKEYEQSRYGAQPGTAQTMARLLKELKL